VTFRGNIVRGTLLGETSLGKTSLGETLLGERALGELTLYQKIYTHTSKRIASELGNFPEH
jgi:hypothetical protein